MIMNGYPQSNDYLPGTWKGLKLQGGQRSATVTCPVCGQTCTLIDHQIDPDGTVSPSLVCPYDCGFHEFIKLEGWADVPEKG